MQINDPLFFSASRVQGGRNSPFAFAEDQSKKIVLHILVFIGGRPFFQFTQQDGHVWDGSIKMLRLNIRPCVKSFFVFNLFPFLQSSFSSASDEKIHRVAPEAKAFQQSRLIQEVADSAAENCCAPLFVPCICFLNVKC